MGGQFLCAGADSVAVLDTGATVNLVRPRRLGRRNKLLEHNGRSRVSTYPACPRNKFGGGRTAEARFAAIIPAQIAGCRGKFTALVSEADIPALLRKGASGVLDERSDFLRVISTLWKQELDTFLRVDQTGHYVLSEVAFGGVPTFSASSFEWAFSGTRPN